MCDSPLEWGQNNVLANAWRTVKSPTVSKTTGVLAPSVMADISKTNPLSLKRLTCCVHTETKTTSSLNLKLTNHQIMINEERDASVSRTEWTVWPITQLADVTVQCLLKMVLSGLGVVLLCNCCTIKLNHTLALYNTSITSAQLHWSELS